MLLRVRASLLNGEAEGKRLLKSFGPELEQSIGSLESRIGVGLKDIDELIVSFHDRQTDDGFRFETFLVVNVL